MLDRVRFIPAHTGNMLSPSPVEIAIAVHPRTHGEHSMVPSSFSRSIGSSPHTRGTYFLYHPEIMEKFREAAIYQIEQLVLIKHSH